MRNFGQTVAALGIALSIAVGSAAAHDPMRVTLNKSKILRFTDPIDTVIVGRSSIADTVVHSNHHLIISAKSVGETDLILLGKTGKEIASFHIVVVPEVNRHVTIHRSPGIIATYSCAPRCTVVESPDGTELSTKSPVQAPSNRSGNNMAASPFSMQGAGAGKGATPRKQGTSAPKAK